MFTWVFYSDLNINANMVSWGKAFLAALKIAVYEFIIGIAVLILYLTYGILLFSRLVSPIGGANLGNILSTNLIFFVGIICLAILGFAVPIKILTELVAKEKKGSMNFHSKIRPNCNSVNSVEARFCTYCGKPFGVTLGEKDKKEPEKAIQESSSTVTENRVRAQESTVKVEQTKTESVATKYQSMNLSTKTQRRGKQSRKRSSTRSVKGYSTSF
jgi:hypothetical protein